MCDFVSWQMIEVHVGQVLSFNSRLARNFTSKSVNGTKLNRKELSSGMLPIVRSMPGQNPLVHTIQSSR